MKDEQTDLSPVKDRRTVDNDGHDLVDPLGVSIVTVSSSRDERSTSGDVPADDGGDAIAEIIEEHGHVVTGRELTPDDYVRIQTTVSELVEQRMPISS